MTSFVVTLAVLAQLGGQSAPNLSGTWEIVSEASIYRDRLGNPINIRILGERLVVRQDERNLTIAIDNEKGFEWRYNLDGSESHHLLPLPKGDELVVSKLSWVGKKLHISMGSRYDSSNQSTLRTMELTPDGALRVEAPFGENRAMIASVYRRVRED
jgi:hypothetical protein